ncbi:MAG: hypothetical protein HN941_04205 [Proteobacteria bacterium]|nr:hypothetical protein [Pseudomonadota bacterium]MBT7770454.1 hypothetical protein [Rhodospirillales bacterium]
MLRQLGTAEPAKPLLHPAMAEVYRSKVAELHQALEDEHLGAEAMDAIRSLIDEIVLTPEDGELRIDLKGDLAGILAMASKNTKKAPRKSRTPQCK